MDFNRRTFLGLTSAGLISSCSGKEKRLDIKKDGKTFNKLGGKTGDTLTSNNSQQNYLRTNWLKDDFSFGSYSYVPKGVKIDQRVNYSKPIDQKIYFIGEATRTDYPSTVHGAYMSGVDLAKQAKRINEQLDIVVIGAGISGLAFANELQDTNHEVLILEGRERIGGRIHSVKFNGGVVELGASWIHGHISNPIYDLAVANEIELVKTDYENKMIFGADNSAVLSALHDLEMFLDKGDFSKLDSKSFYDLIPGSYDRKILDYVISAEIENEAGVDISHLGSSWFEDGSEVEGDDFIFPNGYSAIIELLSQGLDIKLNHRVEKISYIDDCKVYSESKIFNADIVVVSVPLGVLKNNTIQFDPPLPNVKAESIAKLDMGLLDKLYVDIDSQNIDIDSQNVKDFEYEFIGWAGGEKGQFAEWVNLGYYNSTNTLMCFNSGDFARTVSDYGNDQVLSIAREVIQKFNLDL